MLDSIELRNFKSARHLLVKLAPLTVLTGLNGSGKSTVLQALALIEQSIGGQSALRRASSSEERSLTWGEARM